MLLAHAVLERVDSVAAGRLGPLGDDRRVDAEREQTCQQQGACDFEAEDPGADRLDVCDQVVPQAREGRVRLICSSVLEERCIVLVPAETPGDEATDVGHDHVECDGYGRCADQHGQEEEAVDRAHLMRRVRCAGWKSTISCCRRTSDQWFTHRGSPCGPAIMTACTADIASRLLPSLSRLFDDA